VIIEAQRVVGPEAPAENRDRPSRAWEVAPRLLIVPFFGARQDVVDRLTAFESVFYGACGNAEVAPDVTSKISAGAIGACADLRKLSTIPFVIMGENSDRIVVRAGPTSWQRPSPTVWLVATNEPPTQRDWRNGRQIGSDRSSQCVVWACHWVVSPR
jgi:hypothetical protein